MEQPANDVDVAEKILWCCGVCFRWLEYEYFAEPPGPLRGACGTCTYGESWQKNITRMEAQEIDEATRATAIGQGAANDSEEYLNELALSPTVSWHPSGSSSDGDPDDRE